MIVKRITKSSVIHFLSEIHFLWLQLIIFCSFKGIVDIIDQLNFQVMKRIE